MTDSIFMKAMEVIRDRIQDMDLPGITDDRIKVRRLGHDGEHWHEGITIHPVPEKYHMGTNRLENVGYGCAVTMVINNNNDDDYKLDRLLLWREEIRREFVEDTVMVGLGTLCTTKVEMERVIEWDELFEKNLDVSRLVIRVYSLETRT